MANIPPPPVPPRLREMLKDYPELVQKIQDELDWIVGEMVGRSNVTHPYERAVWRLEDSLEDLYIRARRELEAIELGGDLQAIERAKQKLHLIGRIGSDRPWHDDGDESLWSYFENHKEAFE
jgi:hypothetical protein